MIPSSSRRQSRNARLDYLAELPYDWNSYGALPPQSGVIDRARSLLGALDAEPVISLTESGGVNLSWHDDNVIIEIEPLGRVSAMIEDIDLISVRPPEAQARLTARLSSTEWINDLLHLFRYDYNEYLSWTADTDAPRDLHFRIRCDEVFGWGCADHEVVTETDLPDLLRARSDMERSLRVDEEGEWPALWVARKRGQRPMPVWLSRSRPETRALFEAAGPPRTSTWTAP